MSEPQRVLRALRRQKWPAWIASIQGVPMRDWTGDAALQITVVVRPGKVNVLEERDKVDALLMRLRDAVFKTQTDLWPYIRFMSAKDFKAA